jgi:hypothetical protein
MERTTILLVATTLVFGSASAYFYNDLREARSQTEALRAKVVRLEAAARNIARRTLSTPSSNPFNATAPVANAAAPTKRAATTAVGEPPPPPPLVVNPFLAANGGTLSPMDPQAARERARQLMADPEYRDAMRRQQRLSLPMRYPDLQAALQLDEQQNDQLLELLADQQMRTFANHPPMMGPEARSDQAAALREWQAEQARLQSEQTAEIAALLGDAKAQQWRQYQESIPARFQLRELRSSLETAGMPLQSEQTEKLVATLTAERQNAVPTLPATRIAPGQPIAAVDRTAWVERQIESMRQQHQRVRAATAPYLSAQQLEHLERIQANQLEMQQISLKMMRAQAAAEARGDLPPANQAAVQIGSVNGAVLVPSLSTQ